MQTGDNDKIQFSVWPWMRIPDHNPEKVVACGASMLMRQACRQKLGILLPLKAQMRDASEDVKLAAENVCGKAV